LNSFVVYNIMLKFYQKFTHDFFAHFASKKNRQTVVETVPETEIAEVITAQLYRMLDRFWCSRR